MKRYLMAASVAALMVTNAHAAEVTWWKKVWQSNETNLANPDSYGIKIKGELVEGDSERFKDAFSALLTKHYPGNSWKTKDLTIVVHLESPGGMVAEAIKIGSYVKGAKFNTAVGEKEVCASACGLIWLAGNKRYVHKQGYIGFHAVFNTKSKRESSSGNAIVGAYLGSLGYSYDAIAYLTQAPSDKMEWLNADVAKKYGIDALTCDTNGCKRN